MKITWLSATDAPAADFTARVLPQVEARHEVVLPDPRNPPWAELNRADVAVFVIGGDEMSEAIRRLSQRHPGVVIAVGDVTLEAGDALGVLVDSPAAAERLASSACPVAEAPAWSDDDPGPWVKTFEELLAAAERFRPLLAARRLGQTVSDELSLWSGFPSAGELYVGVEEHSLHRRIVEPLAEAVDAALERGDDGEGPRSGD